MAVEPESAAIVSALVGLGNGLGFTILAKGIENGKQEAMLLAQGCQQGQGYLFGKAIPAHQTKACFAEVQELSHVVA